jgi:hypothetical protein
MAPIVRREEKLYAKRSSCRIREQMLGRSRSGSIERSRMMLEQDQEKEHVGSGASPVARREEKLNAKRSCRIRSSCWDIEGAEA